ncbi:MAG TPA: response regulator transcription factor [Hyphomonadaceae bacterium]|nr:response regulator transcription factor [Hyphomonadaceae bacterium]
MSMRILVIEDEARTADFIERGLKEKGHAVDVCRTGPEGLNFALSGEHDAIILDRMLPQMDGLTILKALRAEDKNTPAIILSALAQTDHKVEGLRAGGDDYLVKPFAFSELLARLEAIIRRHDPRAAEQTELKVDDLKLDLVARRASRGGREIDLFPREFSILEYMMRNAGRPVTRTMLLNHVWDYQFEPQANVVDVHISRLRRKIDTPGEKPLIETLRGEGYRIRAAA